MALAGYNPAETLIPKVDATITAVRGGGVPAGIIGRKGQQPAANANELPSTSTFQTIPEGANNTGVASGSKPESQPPVANAGKPESQPQATGDSKDIYLGGVFFTKMRNPVKKPYNEILADPGSKKVADLLHLEELGLDADKKARILQEIYDSECLKDTSLGGSGKCEDIRDVMLMLSTVLVKVMVDAKPAAVSAATDVSGTGTGPKKDIVRIQIDIPFSKFGNLSAGSGAPGSGAATL